MCVHDSGVLFLTVPASVALQGQTLKGIGKGEGGSCERAS